MQPGVVGFLRRGLSTPLADEILMARQMHDFTNLTPLYHASGEDTGPPACRLRDSQAHFAIENLLMLPRFKPMAQALNNAWHKWHE